MRDPTNIAEVLGNSSFETGRTISGLDQLMRATSKDSCLTSMIDAETLPSGANNLSDVTIQDIQNHLSLTRQLTSTLENVLAMKLNTKPENDEDG